MVLTRRVSVGGSHRYCLQTSSECGIGNGSHLNCSGATVARAQNSLVTSGCFHLAQCSHGVFSKSFGEIGNDHPKSFIKKQTVKLLRTHGLLKSTDLRPL